MHLFFLVFLMSSPEIRLSSESNRSGANILALVKGFRPCATRIDWSKLDIPAQSSLMKELQRDAALFARDKIFLESPKSNNSVLIRLSSIARSVWSADKRLYRKLITHSELAREHLSLDDSGQPTLAKPAEFEELVRNIKCSHFDDSRKEVEEQYSNCKPGASNGDVFLLVEKNETGYHL